MVLNSIDLKKQIATSPYLDFMKEHSEMQIKYNIIHPRLKKWALKTY